MTKRIFGMLIVVLSGMLMSGCVAAKVNVTPQQPQIFETRTVPSASIAFNKTNTATLSAVGDILIHGTVYDDARTDSGYDFNPMFENVKPFMERSDITVANSESIIGGAEIGVSTYPSFNSPYEVGDALKYAGVDVVAMANNHTLDRGITAIENAIGYWDRIGVKHTGSALSEEAGAEITAITENGITFSFLSFTYGTNGVPTPAGKDFLVNRIDQAKIKKDLERAKQQSDVVVLNLHFGEEYMRMPNDEQISLAHFAAENGADIILGHHPHVLQPAEWIETEDGRKTFVIYSLGNFLSGQADLYKRIGGILHIEVEKTITKDGKQITVKNPSFTNTYVRDNNLRQFRLDLLKNVDPALNEEIKDHMSAWIEDLEFVE